MISEQDVELDLDRILEVSKVLRSVELTPLNYFDERYYPPPTAERELQLAYFTAVVGIDHRTSTFGPFEGWIDGEFFHGSDALYRLAKKAFDVEPGLFSVEGLANLSLAKAVEVFSIGGRTLWDLPTRVLLLNDIGRKVGALFKSFSNMFDANSLEELRSRLSNMRAYEDPVGKKFYLLVKFLSNRGLIVVDKRRVRIPVDNHVSRIAIRLGLVNLPAEVLYNELEVTRDEDVVIRSRVSEAWSLVSRFSGIDVFSLDDYLWQHGRRVCTRGTPSCSLCPLTSACRAYEEGKYPNEHKHLVTFYY